MNEREGVRGLDEPSDEIPVRLGDRSHAIRIRPGILAEVGAELAHRLEACRALLVADRTVADLHGQALRTSLDAAGFSYRMHLVPPGEATKSLEELGRLYGTLADGRFESREPIVALGGGVVGDLAGLAAATYRRGLPIVHVPTSLVAQVDSSIGGKTAVNLPLGKNLVGAFHQPIAVFTDPELLGTLREEEYRSGLAEVVKYGVLGDADLFGFLETQATGILERDATILTPVIRRCARIKGSIVEADEREEKGDRLLLNLGHTVGHALEAVVGYGRLRHGDAVAVGTACACRLAERRGELAPEARERVVALLERLGLPVVPPGFDREIFVEHLRRDKKIAGGKIRYILPVSVGSARVEFVSEEEVLSVV